jgi:hypothetical protein
MRTRSRKSISCNHPQKTAALSLAHYHATTVSPVLQNRFRLCGGTPLSVISFPKFSPDHIHLDRHTLTHRFARFKVSASDLPRSPSKKHIFFQTSVVKKILTFAFRQGFRGPDGVNHEAKTASM